MGSVRLAAVVAALAVGFCGEPFCTAGVGDQTMLAPDLAAIVLATMTISVFTARAAWLFAAAALLPAAVMLHPYSVCLVPGLVLVALWHWRRGEGRVVLAALLVGVVAATPEVIHVAGLWSRGGEHSAVSSTVGFVSGHLRTPRMVLVSSWDAWLSLRPVPSGPLLLAGAGFLLVAGVPSLWRELVRGAARRSSERAFGPEGTPRSTALPQEVKAGAGLLAVAVLAGMISLVGAGMKIGLLHPYHWRILLPGHALLLGLATYVALQQVGAKVDLTRYLPRETLVAVFVVVGSCIVISMAWVRLDRAPPGDGHLRTHQWMTETIARDAGTSPRWFDAVALGFAAHPFCGAFTPTVFLDQRMAGLPRESFHSRGTLYLALSGSAADLDRVCRAMGWTDLTGGDWRQRTGQRTLVTGSGAEYEVRAIGRYAHRSERDVLLVRIPDRETCRTWTGSLFELFPRGDVYLMLDAVHYLPLTTTEFDSSDVFDWFDDEMLQLHWERAETPEFD